MFYQCPKCKKIWQYPIEKCPACFLNLERMKSEKLKVIGISKVNIPTMFHAKVPYFVLVLEDEKGNRGVQKSTKEYKIGDLFQAGACSCISPKHPYFAENTSPQFLESLIKYLFSKFRPSFC